MKQISIALLILLFSFSATVAQQNDSTQVNPYTRSKTTQKSPLAQKIYFGGDFVFTIGSYTSIGIWPLVGYKVTPKLSLGLQPGYEYIKYENYYGSDYETSNYGARLFTRYRVIPAAYAHVEFAGINYKLRFRDTPTSPVYEERTWVPFLFVGAGLSQRIGGSTYAYVQVLYDVLQDENSPYSNNELFWSVGIMAGF